MKRSLNLSFVPSVELSIQDNEEGGTGDTGSGTGTGSGGNPDQKTGDEKKFTTEEVNKIVAGRVSAMKAQLSKTEQSLTTALSEKGLCEETRDRKSVV